MSAPADVGPEGTSKPREHPNRGNIQTEGTPMEQRQNTCFCKKNKCFCKTRRIWRVGITCVRVRVCVCGVYRVHVYIVVMCLFKT